jgi:sec-independent protein translocase protein TatB
MARQSELDELRKEVEALRTGQTVAGQGLVRLGAEADAAFRDIKSELDKPAIAPAPSVALNSPEFPEPAMTPLPVADAPPGPAASPTEIAAAAVATPARAPKPRKARAPKPDTPATAKKAPKAETASTARPRAPRKPKATP